LTYIKSYNFELASSMAVQAENEQCQPGKHIERDKCNQKDSFLHSLLGFLVGLAPCPAESLMVICEFGLATVSKLTH